MNRCYFLSPSGLGRLVPLRAGLRMRAMREDAVAQTSLGREQRYFHANWFGVFTPPYICELLRPTTVALRPSIRATDKKPVSYFVSLGGLTPYPERAVR